MNWFQFNGGNPADSTNYTLVGSAPVCASPEEKICAIRTTKDSSSNPILDVAILSEMVEALELEYNTTNVRLKKRL